MSDQLSSSHFRSLLGTALQNYERQTGTKLDDHPLFQRVKACDSVESITTVLREQARALHEFRGDDGKVMKSLKCAVDILNTLSTSTVLGEGIGLPFPPAKAIFAGIAILLGVCLLSHHHPRIIVIHKCPRRSRTLVLATMRSLTCSSRSRAS
ncbi:hypothetical protein BJV74DRAFT_867298 [Russula compacta]|nr:hypothetical protein BJV74DRAFT_867298 [Russula compacta]